jgi:hypothetical protein
MKIDLLGEYEEYHKKDYLYYQAVNNHEQMYPDLLYIQNNKNLAINVKELFLEYNDHETQKLIIDEFRCITVIFRNEESKKKYQYFDDAPYADTMPFMTRFNLCNSIEENKKFIEKLNYMLEDKDSDDIVYYDIDDELYEIINNYDLMIDYENRTDKIVLMRASVSHANDYIVIDFYAFNKIEEIVEFCKDKTNLLDFIVKADGVYLLEDDATSLNPIYGSSNYSYYVKFTNSQIPQKVMNLLKQSRKNDK